MKATPTENILISIIGDRDPVHFAAFSKIGDLSSDDILQRDPGPIVETIELLDAGDANVSYPSRVYLLFTDDKKPHKKILERKNWLIKFFIGKGIEAIAIDLEVDNPTDHARLLTSMSVHITTLNQRHKDSSFSVLTSPGTPQMQMAWAVLGNEGKIRGAFLQKIPGTRDYIANSVVKRHDAGRLEPLTFSPIFETERINQAVSALGRMDFATGQVLFEALKNETLFPHRKRSFTAAKTLCGMFAEIGRTDLKAAIERIEAEISGLNTFFENGLFSDRLLDCLRTLKAGNDVLTRVLNVYAKAQRRFRARDYSYCLVECFTAYELMLTATLIRYGVSNPSEGEIWVKEERLLGENIPWQIRHEPVTLERVSPPDSGMLRLREKQYLYNAIDRIRIKRNNVVHKSYNPQKAAVAKDLSTVEDAICLFFSLPNTTISAFPLSIAVIEELERRLRLNLNDYSPVTAE